MRKATHLCFGVAHSRRAVSVYAAKVALPCDAWHAHRKVLRHTHKRVIHGCIAVRVIAPDNSAHNAGGFYEICARFGLVILHSV